MKLVKLRILFAAIHIFNNVMTVNAQHDHPTRADSIKHPKKMVHDTLRVKTKSPHAAHYIDATAMMDVPMSHSHSLSLPMSRNGSGTSWLPDASPMYGLMNHSGKWMFMFHGNIAPRYIVTDIGEKASRGDKKFSVPNWFMAMGQREIGQNGLFHFNVMLSLDRLTEGGDGYPLLFQTGETWKGQPLVDKQHPHDLFSELSIAYSHAFSDKTDLSVYLGYPGEPALGSVAFMHRSSGLANPDAPVSHHWNDGTHITFGVATLGFRADKLKFEVSSFTGREPDEDRFDLDKPRFDSYSGRILYNPSENWTFQLSKGWIKSPEALHGDEDVNRTIASVVYSRKMREERFLNATALWGLNKSEGHEGENAALFEASYRADKLELYSRFEWVQKSPEELALAFGVNHFNVNALTVGVHYDVLRFDKLRLAAGTQLTGYHAASMLKDIYGKNPYSGQVFLRLYPGLMKM